MDAFETDRLHIRPFRMDDLDAAHQLLDIDLQWAGPSFSHEARKHRLQQYIHLSAWSEGGHLYGYRAIILKSSRQLIGLCGFLPSIYTPELKALFWPHLYAEATDTTDIQSGTMELSLGYALSSQHRSQGFATEAIGALVNYAFGTLQIKRLFAETNRSNTGSIHLMQRIGMRTASNPEHPEKDWPGDPGIIGVIDNIKG